MKKDTRHKEVILAYLEGKEVQIKITNGWTEASEPSFNEGTDYRIKPEPQLIPFDFSDADLLIGRAVRSKDGSMVGLITKVGVGAGLKISEGSYYYAELLSRFTFLDGEPCGKEVQS
jgi:hypothetical protein